MCHGPCQGTGDSEVNSLCSHGKWPESQVGNTDIKYITTCMVSVVTKVNVVDSMVGDGLPFQGTGQASWRQGCWRGGWKDKLDLVCGGNRK